MRGRPPIGRRRRAPFAPWDAHYRGDRMVVFGHWARRGFERTERVIALDSGCVYGNELTAWIAEEDPRRSDAVSVEDVAHVRP